MEKEIDWDAIPGERFEAYLRRIELVEYLLDERINRQDKKKKREQYTQYYNVTSRTIRNYISRYKKKGALSLLFYKQKNKSIRIHDNELREKILKLLGEEPTRSVPKLRKLLSLNNDFRDKISEISDRTIYRFLCENNLSFKERYSIVTENSRKAYHRFEAPHSMSLVQGDARDGIWITLPDGKVIKTYLFLWIDDYSRKILFGKYYTNEKLPCMEDSFKYMLLRWGIPLRTYLDNGSVYISRHFYYILSSLKIKWIHHPPYKAHCKGKIEHCNKIIKNDFQKEASLARIHTVEELNTAFWAWCELEYNKRINSATGQAPDERFHDGLLTNHRRITDLEKLNMLFLFRDTRKITRYGKIKLYKNEYPVTQMPHGKVVTVRFDPFNLDEVFVYDSEDNFLEKTNPSKKVNNRAPNMPEEKKKTKQKISQESINYFTKLREEHLKIQKEKNSTDFSKIIIKNKEKNN